MTTIAPHLQVYGRYVDSRGLRLEGLQQAYDDGAGDLDRDYTIVSQWHRSGGASAPPIRRSTYMPAKSPRVTGPGGFSRDEKVAIMFRCFDKDCDGRWVPVTGRTPTAALLGSSRCLPEHMPADCFDWRRCSCHWPSISSSWLVQASCQ